jgi:hypothetical protein
MDESCLTSEGPDFLVYVDRANLMLETVRRVEQIDHQNAWVFVRLFYQRIKDNKCDVLDLAHPAYNMIKQNMKILDDHERAVEKKWAELWDKVENGPWKEFD